MARISMWISPLEPSSMDEVVNMFFAKRRRKIARSLWKYLSKMKKMSFIDVLALAVELTGNVELQEYFSKFQKEITSEDEYETVLELKKKLLTEAIKLNINLTQILEDISYIFEVMQSLELIIIEDHMIKYTPERLAKRFKKVAELLEKTV